MVRIDFNRLRFLIIDDNAHMRRILRTLLHGFGTREVYEAEDGAGGPRRLHALLARHRDHRLGDADLRRARADADDPPAGRQHNPYVPIIMLTGHSEKKRVIAARDAGVTEFLAKPISAKGLYQRVLNVVANPRPFIRTKSYFGPGPAAQRQSELCRAGAAQRRQGRRHQAAAVARQGEDDGMSEADRKMSDRKADLAAVSTFADHEVIVPPNKLKKAVQKVARHHLEFDPVAKAEAALAELSKDFSAWMGQECDRLDAARHAMRAGGINQGTRDGLFLAAHDIKGQAATFGFPLVAPVADSLCRLIEHTPDMARLPFA
jgi:CheY-like chemotaxis protein